MQNILRNEIAEANVNMSKQQKRKTKTRLGGLLAKTRCECLREGSHDVLQGLRSPHFNKIPPISSSQTTDSQSAKSPH